MYHNIIIGVDGRQGGRDAAALAGLLAGTGARRHLVHVDAEPHNGHGSSGDLHLELADPDLLPALVGAERRLAGGVAPTISVVAASVAAGLGEIASGEDADLVVVGSSRHEGIARHLGHDDVVALLRETTETIAVAPHGYSDEPRRIERIGIAFDGSPESFVALAHGGLLAEARECEVVVSRLPGPDVWPPSAPAIHAAPRAGLKPLSRGVDLLICGSRRMGAMRRLTVGSTSEYLTRHVDVPLIITAPVDTHAVGLWHERHRDRDEEVAR
jgi:nucleotide-binding universal stress UspA family protein